MYLHEIKKKQFPQWKKMRQEVYSSLNNKFHEIEMKQIFESRDWFCCFIMSKNEQVLGFTEISSRNIVDGCLSSPVAYLEGLYLKKEHRGKGAGRETVEIIKAWCKAQGFTELGVDTELDNFKAQLFFKAVGLQETYKIVQFRAVL